MGKLAVRNLLSRPMRSLLSLLGLTVAIIGMVGLFSVAEGLDATVSKTFGRIPGLVAMQPGAPIPLFSTLPASWQQEIAEIEGVRAVSAEVWQRVNVIDGKTIVSPPRFLFGADIPSRLELEHGVYDEEIEAGRFLTLEDRGTLNTVVSRQIAEEFGKGVGDTLRVNGHDMTIVGIYHVGSLLLDVAIILDIDVVRQIARFEPNSVSGYYIEQTGEVPDDELVRRIKAKFRGREIEKWQPSSLGIGLQSSGNWLIDFFQWTGRALQWLEPPRPPRASSPMAEAPVPSRINGMHEGVESPVESSGGPPRTEKEEAGIEIRTALDWAERFDEFSADLNLFLTIMTGIGVTIAVLSIVNTMLMSVTERIIEFGILKANGWSRYDVLRLVTFESAILGIGGGICGSILGWCATEFGNWYWQDRVNLYASPQLLAFAILFSTALGILGGLYPAIWAMRMMPMEAIRRG